MGHLYFMEQIYMNLVRALECKGIVYMLKYVEVADDGHTSIFVSDGYRTGMAW